MEERIDILTKNGILTGRSCLKSEIHAKGYYHNTAHVWFYNSIGEILLQQRSFSKIICPGLWDVSVAGHVDAGETIIEAAVREVKEEIGIDILPDDLFKVGTFNCFNSYKSGIIDNEFHNTFICELNFDVDELKFSGEEVEAIKMVSMKEFENLLQNSQKNNHFVATNSEYYKTVLGAIKQRLK